MSQEPLRRNVTIILAPESDEEAMLDALVALLRQRDRRYQKYLFHGEWSDSWHITTFPNILGFLINPVCLFTYSEAEGVTLHVGRDRWADHSPNLIWAAQTFMDAGGCHVTIKQNPV